jgi:glycerate kinase
LVATGSFGPGLPAPRVASAIARGLRAGGLLAPEECPLPPAKDPAGETRAFLDALDFDARLRRARALILGEARMQARTLQGSAAFEIATRARQAGVPAYAVTGDNRLDLFDARILDLQLILVANGTRALAAAGTELARLL